MYFAGKLVYLIVRPSNQLAIETLFIYIVFLLMDNKSINKRPKGPHIVHLSTICHLFEESAKANIFIDWSAR